MLLSKLPKRLERVGNDCVMIPEKSMMESEWDEKCWSCIAKSVSAKMLVRRATIDTGRMRQSRVVVLHNDTNSTWVEVKQHSIRYTFDITRVMFSAGNTTERKRMGTCFVNLSRHWIHTHTHTHTPTQTQTHKTQVH